MAALVRSQLYDQLNFSARAPIASRHSARNIAPAGALAIFPFGVANRMAFTLGDANHVMASRKAASIDYTVGDPRGRRLPFRQNAARMVLFFRSNDIDGSRLAKPMGELIDLWDLGEELGRSGPVAK